MLGKKDEKKILSSILAFQMLSKPFTKATVPYDGVLQFIWSLEKTIREMYKPLK